MASVGAVSPGGFEADFIDPLDKDYECPVCLLALRNPLQTSCGHLICTSCADYITQKGQLSCPLDKQVSDRKDLFPDTFNGRKILSLKVKCPHHARGCYWTGELRHLQRHTDRSGDCKFLTVQCAFSVVGCQKKLTADQCDIHEEQDVKQHIRLLLKSHQTMESQVTEMNTTIQTLQAENSDLKRRIQSCAIPAAVRGLARQFKAYWVIDNWQQTMEAARHENEYVLLSRPYYIEEPGYKVRMQLYPSGYGNGQGTHVSLFFKIMRGRYNDELVWPFSLMFSLAIVDQTLGGRNKLNTLDPPLASAGSADAFKKPTTEMNRGWGWQTFISHADLRTRHYICNNSVKIMLQVYLN